MSLLTSVSYHYAIFVFHKMYTDKHYIIHRWKKMLKFKTNKGKVNRIRKI